MLSFGRGVTAVVGPNGSGKSNINDAVRWVLGEQSTKNLRGQSMEDVIFGGTAERRPQGFAEVTLTIDNTDRSLNFDSDTVAVTRRYYRSHESEYLINKAVVRLKDVNELFMDTGVGRDGYSMIGQGKIDSIVSSRSDERREIFEEAAGISKYRYRKLEAERSLAKADANLLRLNDIMSELEDRVGPLKTQSEKAKKFLEYSEDKKRLDIGIWLYELERHNEVLREQEHKITLAKSQYGDAERSLSEIAEEIEKHSLGVSRSTDMIETLRNSASSLEESAAKAEAQIALINNSIGHNTQTIAGMENDIEELGHSDATVKEEISKRREDAAEKSKSAEKLSEQIKELENEFKSLMLDSENISKDIEEQMDAVSAVSGQLSECRVSAVTAESSVKEIKERKTALDSTIVSRREEAEKLKKESELLENDLKSAEEVIEKHTNSLAGYEKLRAVKAGKSDELKKRLDEIHLDSEEKKRRVSILRDLQKNMDGFSYSVKTVINDSKKGLLRGVIGTVNTVIDVKKEYSTAIEIALGNALQDIVVKNEEDAKRAIRYLKNDKKGRATFLPVSSIIGRVLDEKGLDGTEGFVGLACDLVGSEPEYREIVKSLLGRIAVATDLDAAVSIAKKYKYKFKIVTLDGQTVNAGGSLTGGSLTKNAGILSRSGDIEELEKQISSLAEKAAETENENRELSGEIAKLDSGITSSKYNLSIAQEDKIRILGEIKRVAEQKSFIENDVKSLREENSRLEARLSALQTSIGEYKEKIEKLSQKQAEIQAVIDSKSEGRAGITAKREEINSAVTELMLRKVETEKDVETILSLVKTLEASLNDKAERAEQLRVSIKKLQDENLNYEAQILGKQAETEKLKAETDNISKNIEELKKKRESADSEGQRLRSLEREKMSEREKLGGEVARLEERKESMLTAHDDIIRRLFDEYELTRAEAENIGVKIDGITEARKELAAIKTKIKSLGSVNVSAIEEYKEVSERYEFMTAQIKDIEKSRAEMTKLITSLTGQMEEKFTEGFEKISKNFSATFTDLFGGGKGELSLTDPDNILESGIDINVKLPGKNVPSIEALSGGEKALIAISIYFAIIKVSPPPFCFFDEVDTALDDINVERFANYMHRGDGGTQFICVTHRRGTMEAADMLYGVTMQEKGVTKLLQLNVDELVKTLKLS